MKAYAPRRHSRCFFIGVRNLRYQVRSWGEDGGAPLVLLHGARDTSITFQFLVDLLKRPRRILAPDWRGHGKTDWTRQSYWFHEFVADLDAVLDAVSPSGPVDLVGHSLGGNVAAIYAGLRPERVRRLVSLDGLGPLTTFLPLDVPKIMRSLLSQRHPRPRGPGYASAEDMAERLRRANPRLAADKSLFLAAHSSMTTEDGRLHWLFDPSFRVSVPSFASVEDWGACWSGVTAPVLWIASSDRREGGPLFSPEEVERRMRYFRDVRLEIIPETSHNIQHDDPASAVRLIERFLD